MRMKSNGVVVVALALCLAGVCSSCTQGDGKAGSGVGPRPPLDAGAIADYARDGAYDRFAASHHVMLVTYGGRLTAMSALCTADGGTLAKAKAGDGFVCPKDGSRFDRTGQAQLGKAREPLVHYPLSVTAAGRVLVDLNRPLVQADWDRPEAYLVTGGR
jgi:nitrite reductase/ring-hydroxylating ferredoxin subunit